MGWLEDILEGLFKDTVIDAIMASFEGIFDDVNAQVNDIAVQVGQTPENWNSGVFHMVRTLSETVVLPIAGIILTFILCYELIQLIIEKNNMADFDTFNIFKWMFKTFVAVFILTNTFTIVLAVFEIAQSAVNESATFITGETQLGGPDMMYDIREQLEGESIGSLFALFFEVQVIRLALGAMVIVIFVIVWGRMIEIYITISLAPIPLSTMVNREWGSMGNNYLKALFAVAFQGFLIMVCVAIYAALVSTIGNSDSIRGSIWQVAAYTALLCFILLKSGGIAKSVFN
jgi:hypothetical protein